MSLATIEKYDQSQWQAVADRISQNLETRLFIDGKYVDAIDGGL